MYLVVTSGLGAYVCVCVSEFHVIMAVFSFQYCQQCTLLGFIMHACKALLKVNWSVLIIETYFSKWNVGHYLLKFSSTGLKVRTRYNLTKSIVIVG